LAGDLERVIPTYERGTFTPVLAFSIAGDLAVTYTSQIGRYVRIGRLCHYDISIETSQFDFTTSSQELFISGMPFTAADEYTWGPAASIILGATIDDARGYVYPATAEMYFMAVQSGAWVDLRETHFVTMSDPSFFLRGTYEITAAEVEA
jgi:hypothetical protein